MSLCLWGEVAFILFFLFPILLVKNFHLQAIVVNILPHLLRLSLHMYILIFKPLLLLSLVSVEQFSSTEYSKARHSSGYRMLASVGALTSFGLISTFPPTG